VSTIEIERRFLVDLSVWAPADHPFRFIEQGYISIDPAVRVRNDGAQGFLTIKGKKSAKGAGLELEYPIPLEHTTLLWPLLKGHRIEKLRYTVPHYAYTWEVDEFLGLNEGLYIAEVELGVEDEDFERPDWLGDEITADPRYSNLELALHPYTKWSYR